MRRFPTLAEVALPLAALLYGCQPTPQPASETEEAAPAAMSDEDLMESNMDDFEKAWAAGDAKAIAAQFTADGDFMSPQGELSKGPAEIEQRYREVLDGMYKGTSVALDMTSMTEIEPEVALVQGTYEITGMKSADGSELPAVKGQFMNVVVKHGDHFMVHSSRPMAPVKAPGT
jgi:uncharacterized protein (TIGR02246 family)